VTEHQTAAAGTWLGIERRWLTLIAVCGATFMLLVDITIVQVALPTIQHRLRATFSDLQWSRHDRVDVERPCQRHVGASYFH